MNPTEMMNYIIGKIDALPEAERSKYITKTGAYIPYTYLQDHEPEMAKKFSPQIDRVGETIASTGKLGPY